jgi:hypothetical protein
MPDSQITGFFGVNRAGFITPFHRVEQGYTKQA